MTDVRRVVLGVCVIALACGPVSMLAQSQPSETRAVRRQLTGKVVDVDGRAVSQARVMVGNWERLRRVTVEGNTLAGDPVRIETTRDGRFAIDTTGLSTRGVVVAIAPSGAWAVVDPVLTGDVNLVVTIGSAVKLEGRVTDSRRQPVAGATVRLAAHVGGAWLSRAVVTGGDGVYRMGGLPYDPNQLEYDGAAVVVTAPGFAMQRWSLAWSDEKVGKGGGDRTWTLDVPLSRGGGLTGTVRDQSGEAIAGARVVAWGSTHDIHLSEIDLTATCPDRVIVGSATTTAEGTYEIRNVPLLRQLGWISGEHDWTGTLRSGAQKRFHGGLVVVAKGYDPAMLELPRASREGGVLTQPIVLRPSTRVLGRVVDSSGAGVSGLRVVARFEHGDRMVDQLLFDRGPGDRICEQVTGSAGDFAFDGLPESTVPGRLELWAMDKAGVAQGASAEVVKPGSETTVKDIVLDGRAT